MKGVHLSAGLTQEAAVKRFNRSLGRAGRLVPEAGADQVSVFARDTFDWRFFKRGVLLLEHPEGFSEYSFREERERVLDLDLSFEPGYPPKWAEPIVGPRAIVGVVRWTELRRAYRLEDDQAKCVGWADAIAPTADLPFFGLRIEALRGYEPECKELASKAAGEEPTEAEHFYRKLLSLGGRVAGAYDQAVTLTLGPQLSLRDAYLELFDYFLAVMEENRAGLVQRIDTEFLHDYRVALRRLRSVTSHMKSMMPQELYHEISGALKELFRTTGRARDLDVLSLRRKEYTALLPEALKPGVRVLFDRIDAETAASYESLSARICSGAYQDRLENARSLLHRWSPTSWHQPWVLREAVGRWVRKRNRRILSLLKLLDSGMADTQFHELRVECKKLRYLLEIFGSLYPSEELQPVVKRLKKVQDVLGAQQDLAVQQELLIEILETWGADGAAVSAAIGGVLADFSRRSPKLRKRLKPELRRFRRELSSLPGG
ncbi:MAG: CHAD domain-containing protein [Spirochaetaceae bacterium]